MSNETDKQYVIDQQKKRFSVLDFIWKDTRQQPQSSRNYSTAKEISSATGIDDDELFTALQYLESEGLIELMQHMGQLPYSRVTHSGIVEMESAITNPNQDTNHFFSSVIINFIETMNQTNINAARDAIGNISSSQVNAPVTNTVSYSESDTSEILQAIAELRQQVNTLAEENQDVAIDALDTLESEVKSPTKPTKVKAVLFSLWGIAQGIASFTNAVTSIADRFGVKFHQ
ncbi:MAG: hypothetical protein M1G31_32370 [Pseudanabaena sp. Salubria-1]|nr:hypothetical protein [Pseudanabaena sp. Salubria-1]